MGQPAAKLETDLPPLIRQAAPRDWRQIADITAEAFAEDPVNRWVFGTPRAILSAFRVLMRDIYSRHGICHLSGDDAAAAWMDYSQGPAKDLGWLAQMHLAIGLWRHASKGALNRAMEAGQAMAAHHPTAPHLYLFTIGTRMAARGSGKGSALLRPMLAAADSAGMPCYLENSNPVNHGFYASHGFKRLEVFACGDGGPPLEAMWRDPNPNDAAG